MRFARSLSALHRLTGKNFGDMGVGTGCTWRNRLPNALSNEPCSIASPSAWATWWEANWKSMVDDPAYATVNLPLPAPEAMPLTGRKTPPAGPGVKLQQQGQQGCPVQSAQESSRLGFVDLDTMREAGWPTSLPPVAEIGVDSPQLLAWARKEGFDLVGVTYTPPGDSKPLYCLQPLTNLTGR